MVEGVGVSGQRASRCYRICYMVGESVRGGNGESGRASRGPGRPLPALPPPPPPPKWAGGGEWYSQVGGSLREMATAEPSFTQPEKFKLPVNCRSLPLLYIRRINFF